MKKLFKEESGITLIALIITIIILVILAAVSIRAAYNSGIIDYSINGTLKYQKEANKEESILSETEDFMASILGRLDELGNEDNGNNYVPDILKDYVLGIAVNGVRPGKDLYDILDWDWNIDGAFYNDPSSITDAHDTVIYLNYLWGDLLYPNQQQYFYIIYNNVVYKIVLDYNCVTEARTTTDVVKVYEPNGDEGKIVRYCLDGNDPEECLVLYDNGSSVDITPINLRNDWIYTIGFEDEAALDSLDVEDRLTCAIWSYNHAVDSLNAYAAEIVTNDTAQRVRSIGTEFGVTDTSTKYSSIFLENNPSGQSCEGEFDGVGVVGDLNLEQDVVRLSFFGHDPEYPGAIGIEGDFYMASRFVREDSSSVGFNLYWVSDTGYIWDDCGVIWGVNEEQTYEYNESARVRPVVRVPKEFVEYEWDDDII